MDFKRNFNQRDRARERSNHEVKALPRAGEGLEGELLRDCALRRATVRLQHQIQTCDSPSGDPARACSRTRRNRSFYRNSRGGGDGGGEASTARLGSAHCEYRSEIGMERGGAIAAGDALLALSSLRRTARQ